MASAEPWLLVVAEDAQRAAGRRRAPACVTLEALALSIAGSDAVLDGLERRALMASLRVAGLQLDEPANVRMAERTVAELKQAALWPAALQAALATPGVSTDALAGASSEASGSSHIGRAQALLAAYEDAKSKANRRDLEDVLRLGLERLATSGLPARLRGFSGIVLESPPQRGALFCDWLAAFAQACERAQVKLRVELRGFAHATFDAPWDPLLVALEQRGEKLAFTEVMKHAPEDTRGAAWANVVLDGNGTAPDGGLQLRVFRTPWDEAREMAREVRRLLDSGVAAHAIAVACFEPQEGDFGRVRDALATLGIPARGQVDEAVLASRHVRLALELLRLREADFPASQVSALVEAMPHEASPKTVTGVLGLFREAGIRDNRWGASAGASAYRVKLGELAARKRDRGACAAASAVEAVAAAVERILREVSQIPQRGEANKLLSAWREACSRLGLVSVRSVPVEEGETPVENQRRLALAAEARAVSEFWRVVEHTQKAFEHFSAGRRAATPKTLYRWLWSEASLARTRAPMPPWGVALCDTRELAHKTFAHVFWFGCSDLRFPRPHVGASLLNDEDRIAINRAVGRTVLSVTVGEGETRRRRILAEDQLEGALALAAAQESLWLSSPRLGAHGELQEASGWMMTLSERGAIPVVGWREHAVPDIGAPGKLTERRAAVALVLGAEIGHGAERVAVERARVRQAFGSHVWFNDAMARGEQERERECFFAGNGPPGPASGAVGQSAASDTVLAFPRSAPLTATALGRWANCAFQGFVAHALGVRAESPTDDAPDPRARGILLHRLLELLFRELMKDGTWPPGLEPARVDGLIEHALEGALGQLAKTQSLGHPALVGLLKQEARRAARRVLALALEATGTVGGPPSKVGGTPSEVELHFGDERAAPALREVALVQGDEGDVVFVAGAIDRVDEGPEGLFVIDYKTTAPKRARAREALLTTEFQLPLYLYALQQSGRRIHDAAWLSLRDGQLLRLSQLEGVDIHTLVTQELPSTVLSLRRRLREGVWEPASHDCGRCDFSTVCRISADAKKARKESTV